MLDINQAHALIIALANASDFQLNGRHMIDVEKVVRLIQPYIDQVDLEFKAGDGKYSLKMDKRR